MMTLRAVALLLSAALLLGASVPVPAAPPVAAPVAPAADRPRPQRIAVLFPQSVGLVYLFRLQERVVGMPLAKLAVSNAPGAFYSLAHPGIAKVPDIGFPGQPNVETIAAIRPDLVVEPDFHMKIQPFLEDLAIERFKITGTFSTMSAWLDGVDRFGARVGKPEIAARYRAWFEGKVAFVAGRLAGAKRPRPRVAHILRSGDRLVTHGQKSSFAKDLLFAAGAQPYGRGIVDAPEYALNREELMKFDPEWLLLEEITHASARQPVDLTDPFFAALACVKAGRVLRVPVDDPTCFLTGWFFNYAAPLGLLWTAKALHPDRFSDVDLEAEAAFFYKEFFGIDRAKLIPTAGR